MCDGICELCENGRIDENGEIECIRGVVVCVNCQ